MEHKQSGCCHGGWEWGRISERSRYGNNYGHYGGWKLQSDSGCHRNRANRVSENPANSNDSSGCKLQPGNEPSFAIDGDPSTWWHIKWFNVDPLPQSIILNLGGTYKISKLDYLPRPDGGNGTITAYNVYVSQDGVQYTKVASGVWLQNNVMKEVNFTAVNAAYIKLEATAGAGNFASVSELNVYKIIETPTLQTIAFDAVSYEMLKGQKAAVKVTAQFLDGTHQDVTAVSMFEIGNTALATITNGSIPVFRKVKPSLRQRMEESKRLQRSW